MDKKTQLQRLIYGYDQEGALTPLECATLIAIAFKASLSSMPIKVSCRELSHMTKISTANIKMIVGNLIKKQLLTQVSLDEDLLSCYINEGLLEKA